MRLSTSLRAAVLLPAILARPDPLAYTTVIDDFSAGLEVGTANAKWNYFTFGPFVGNDGVATKLDTKGAGNNKHKDKFGGIEITAPGKNARGEPAYTLTVGQNASVPGDIEHVKYLVFANHSSSKGYPGYDTAAGYVTSCVTKIGGQTYGTEEQPFGGDVKATDPALAWFGSVTGDFEKFMIFDFALTNDAIYVLYERLPFGRNPTNNYASFTHLVPVGKRKVGDEHVLKVSYDRTAKAVTWYVDSKAVFTVDKIGYYLDKAYVAIDRGGVEEDAGDLAQIVCGFGSFTLVDAFNRRLNKGLVNLVGQEGYYRNPVTRGDLAFVDDQSEPSSRLFGQGARMTVRSVSVSSEKAPTQCDKEGNGNGHGNGNGNGQGNCN